MENLEELEAARRAAIEANSCFSKGRLRDEFRMKPKVGAEPIKRYKNGYGGEFGVYRIADCVPLRAVPSREPSSRELRARAITALQSKLRGKTSEAGSAAIGWLAADPLIIDTETTGLGDAAQIVELAIVDVTGCVVYETRLRPSVPVETAAQQVHGISEDDLANAPTWVQVGAQVEEHLRGRVVIIFNSSFDLRLLEQTARAFEMPAAWVRELDAKCAMYLAAHAYGPTNRYGTISLSDAMWSANAEWRGTAHSASADAMAALDVVRAIAQRRQNLEVELDALLKAEQ